VLFRSQHLNVPEMEADKVMNYPNEFIAGTLERLAQWEKENVSAEE